MEKIIGGGVLVDYESEYVKSIRDTGRTYGYIIEDLGLIGLSMMIGIPAVVLLIVLYCMLIQRFREKKYQYIRFTLLVVLLGSIVTTMELFRAGNILIITLFLYLEKNQNKILPLNFPKLNENRNTDISLRL